MFWATFPFSIGACYLAMGPDKTKQFLPENAKVTFREKVNLKNKGEMDTFFLEEIFCLVLIGRILF